MTETIQPRPYVRKLEKVAAKLPAHLKPGAEFQIEALGGITNGRAFDKAFVTKKDQDKNDE